MHDIRNWLQSFSTTFGYGLRAAILPVALLGSAPSVLSQALPTATRPADIQVGGGFTLARPGYQPQMFYGFAIYADVDPRAHWGVEAELHEIFGAQKSRQRTVEIGGRYFGTFGPFVPYAKGMYGRGDFRYPFGFTQLSYNLLTAGGGVDYKATRHIHARLDYEYQHWLGFSNGGLHPQLITFGVAYHFEGKPRFR